MRASAFTFGLLFICAMQTATVSAQTVIVVRHGEKLDNLADPVLSPEGEARAARLANMLAASNVRGIYTTQYKRTMLQAAPTAKLFGVTPESVPGKETATLIAKIRARAKDEVVLVVGHSNTVPEILKGLGHVGEVTVKDDDYDNLFVVVMQPTGAPKVVHLKY
jgi:broad specificity phosphatase PhoE